MKAAIAQAAHDTLVALFPLQATSFADQQAAETRQTWPSTSDQTK